MGNLSSGCGCGNNRMSNCNDCCSIIWIILLLSICGNGGGFFGGNGCGCNDGCGDNSCIWIILLLLFCGGGIGIGFGGNNCGCNNNCGCSTPWNNGCGNNCGDSCGC